MRNEITKTCMNNGLKKLKIARDGKIKIVTNVTIAIIIVGISL
jgi:hypothetical protein